jgi:hypothetical protein
MGVTPRCRQGGRAGAHFQADCERLSPKLRAGPAPVIRRRQARIYYFMKSVEIDFIVHAPSAGCQMDFAELPTNRTVSARPWIEFARLVYIGALLSPRRRAPPVPRRTA